MANVRGPLFSLSAAGSIGKTISYKKGVRGYVARKWAKPSGDASAAQVVVRNFTGERMSHWPDISSENQLTWLGLAQVENTSPINAYLKVNWERYIAGLSTTDVWPAEEPWPVEALFATDLNYAITPDNWLFGFSGEGEVVPVGLSLMTTNCDNFRYIENSGDFLIEGSWDFSLCRYMSNVYLPYCNLTHFPSFYNLSYLNEIMFHLNLISDANEIDNFLIQLASENESDNGVCWLYGEEMGARTNASDAAVADLVSRGWNMQLNNP